MSNYWATQNAEHSTAVTNYRKSVERIHASDKIYILHDRRGASQEDRDFMYRHKFYKFDHIRSSWFIHVQQFKAATRMNIEQINEHLAFIKKFAEVGTVSPRFAYYYKCNVKRNPNYDPTLEERYASPEEYPHLRNFVYPDLCFCPKTSNGLFPIECDDCFFEALKDEDDAFIDDD